MYFVTIFLGNVGILNHVYTQTKQKIFLNIQLISSTLDS